MERDIAGHSMPAGDRRGAERHLAVFRMGRLVVEGQDRLCVVRNISSTGLMASIEGPPTVDAGVAVELKSNQPLAGVVRWAKDGSFGMQFAEPIDVAEALGGRRFEDRKQPRSPRFERHGEARITRDGEGTPASVVNISLSGLCLRTDVRFKVGEPVVVRVEALDPVGPFGTLVRWTADGLIGVQCDRPLPYAALSRWLDAAAAGFADSALSRPAAA